MGQFDGHEELHDIYHPINPYKEAQVFHKVGKVKRRSLGSVASVPAAAGLLVAGAAVVVLGLAGLPTFDVEINDVARTTASVDVISDLGLSDAQYPLEYRLYRVDPHEQFDEQGNPLYEDIALDPRPVEEKYEILETVETGDISDPEVRLSFEDLTPGTHYLLLLYRNGEAVDVTDAYGVEVHFLTLGKGGGGAPPAPTPPPVDNPDEDQGPAPETDEPEPEPDPQPTMHTIIFADEDGTEISSAEYEEGTLAADIAVPADPTKDEDANYTYEFAGWTPDIADVTKDATYTATYTATQKTPKYTIRFVNWDGSVISSRQYERGTRASAVTVPADPTRPAADGYVYEFIGWNPETIADVYGNATYSARYEAKTAFLITFYDHDGTVLLSDYFEEGTSLDDVAPEPTREPEGDTKFIFGGWEPDLQEVTEDTEYWAFYDEAFTITFVDWDDTVISQEDYAAGTPGDEVDRPADPSRPDSGIYTYEFISWDPETIDDVWESRTYRAVYRETHKPLKVSITGSADYDQYASISDPNPGGGYISGTVTFTDNTFFTELSLGDQGPSRAAIYLTWQDQGLEFDLEDSSRCTVSTDGSGYVTSLAFHDVFVFDDVGAAATGGTLGIEVLYYDENGDDADASASTSVGVATMALPGPITLTLISGEAYGTMDDEFNIVIRARLDVSNLRLTEDELLDTLTFYAFNNPDYSAGPEMLPVISGGYVASLEGELYFDNIPDSLFSPTNPSVPVTVVADYYFEQTWADGHSADIHNVQSGSGTCTNITYEP